MEGTVILSRTVEQTPAITIMRWDWGKGNTMKSDSQPPQSITAILVLHATENMAICRLERVSCTGRTPVIVNIEL